MRGLLVAFFVLLVWSSPALPQASEAEPVHGKSCAVGRWRSGGHALDSGQDRAQAQEASAAMECVECDKAASERRLSMPAGRGALVRLGRAAPRRLHGAARALDALLWIYTRRVANAAQDRRRAYSRGRAGLCVRRSDRPLSAARSGERQARHAELRQDAGGDPRVVGRVRGAGAARGQARLRRVETDRRPTRSSNRSSCSPRRPCSARKLPRRSSSSAISSMKTCSGSRTRRGSVSAWRATARRPMPVMPNGMVTTERSRPQRL